MMSCVIYLHASVRCVVSLQVCGGVYLVCTFGTQTSRAGDVEHMYMCICVYVLFILHRYYAFPITHRCVDPLSEEP